MQKGLRGGIKTNYSDDYILRNVMLVIKLDFQDENLRGQ